MINETEVRNEYTELTRFLIHNKITISTMESATAGLLSSLITDTEGSSAVFKGGFVTYCNEAKIQMGVDKNVIEKFSVYSKQTAEQMALCCARAFKTDIGIGISGTMGNVDKSNLSASVPGNVYFAFSVKGKLYSFYEELPFYESRIDYKLAVADLIVRNLFILLK